MGPPVGRLSRSTPLGDAGRVLGGSAGLLFATEDEAAALALGLGGVVDLLPEAYEVVDGRDDGDDGHPINRGDGDEVNADDEATVQAGKPEPIITAVGEDGGDDRDDLNDGLELAKLAGFDGEALGRRDGAKAGDQKFAANHKDGDPGRNDARVIGNQDDIGRSDHELVRERVEEHTHGGDLFAPARKISVEAVGDAGKDEDDAGDDLLFAAAKPRGAVT